MTETVHHHYHHHMVRLVDVILVVIIIILLFLLFRAKGYIINSPVNFAPVAGISPSYQGNSYSVTPGNFDLTFNPWGVPKKKDFSNTTTNCGCAGVGFGGSQYGGAPALSWQW